MPAQLTRHVDDPAAFEANAIARLKYVPRRRATARLHPEDDFLARAETNRGQSSSPLSGDLTDDELRLDAAAILAQAETDDLALVRLAAGRLAAALREVHLLLGRGPASASKREALQRCLAKGWITVLGDDLGEAQTFRVTAEGYRAAGLRVPIFSV